MKKMLLTALIFTASLGYAQEGWVSVSNDLIRVSMDVKTGRYLISDAANTYAPPPSSLTNWPRHLAEAAPLTDSNIIRSAMLGSAPYAANTAVFNINGTPVVFGSAPGQWILQPVADQAKGEILYGWRLGGFEIFQILTIISNKETLLKDAVSITYQIQNNSSNALTAGAKIILDPIPGDGQPVPFRLPEGISASSEVRFTRANMPEYWLSSDREGGLSPYTVRGVLKGSGAVRPDSVVFTTLENALKARWEHYLNTSIPLGGQDTAVILTYDPVEINPGNSRSVSTIVGISGIVNGENNGLKINASVFSAQESNPARLGFWLTNSSRELFDQVILELSAPPILNILSSPRQEVLNLGAGQEHYVEWLVASTSDEPGTYRIELRAQARRNGRDAAVLAMPFSITWSSNTRSGENDAVQQSLDAARASVSLKDALPQNTGPKTGAYLLEDTLGPTSESLAKLKEELQNSRMDNVEELLKLIDSEQQLIKEIIGTERSIGEINQQYTILRRIYRRLYESPAPIDDREQIRIQELKDGLSLSEQQLKEQERSLESVLQKNSALPEYESMR